jgi:PAS domain S-box-containing protein
MNPTGLTDVRVLGLIEAIRHVPAAVAVVDASGQIVYVNERAMELTERQLGESMPEDLGGAIDIFHLDGRRYERDEWPVVRSITSGEEVVDEEYFYVLPAGGRLVVRGTSSAVYDEEGTIVAGVIVMVDITAEKQQAEPDEVRILLVEDHAAMREALAAMLDREPDFTVVGQAGSLEEARGMLEGVDVAVLDLGLPDGFGADLIQELRATNPRAEALVLSASLDRTSMGRAVESGAAGAIDKVAHLDEVVDAVRRVRAGESLLPLDEVVELLDYEQRRREQEHDDRQAMDSLTAREREVLQALADGLDSQAAADRLHITLRTERNHVANILAKLRVHSRLQALVLCLRYGVVEIR